MNSGYSKLAVSTTLRHSPALAPPSSGAPHRTKVLKKMTTPMKLWKELPSTKERSRRDVTAGAAPLDRGAPGTRVGRAPSSEQLPTPRRGPDVARVQANFAQFG